MLKVAFIGDSYASYGQTGQGKNNWTYLLAKHFPQHQYYNYAIGGRGYDFYQICLLDAKIRNIDVILINKTFPHRVLDLTGDGPHSFVVTTIDDNYFTLNCENVVWGSLHISTSHFTNDKDIPVSVQNSFNDVLKYKGASEQNIDYKEKWYENMHSLYNFKHIVKLSLLRKPNLSGDSEDSAYQRLWQVFNITERIHKQMNKNRESPQKPVVLQNKILFEAGLTISPEDDHWSPTANKWVFDNYILPRVVDILS